MVDSLIFRINDLYKYRTLVEYLKPVTEGKGTFIKVLDEKMDITKEIYLKRYYVDFATGNSWPESYRHHLKSSNYDISYVIDTKRDFIEFNISLPKYWFGNNLCQLVDHWLDDRYLHFKNSEFWNCKVYSFQRFSQVWNHFLSSLPHFVDKADVTIDRIDLCFNLIFRNQSDALFYLSELMHVKRKRWRNTQSSITNYLGQSIYFASKDFTFKVYHKGVEFRKNSYNQVKKRYGKAVAEKIYEMACNVLRYEVELRPGMLTQIFLSKLTKENPKIYKAVRGQRQLNKNGYVVLSDGEKYNFDGSSNKTVEFGTKSEFKKLPAAVAKHLNIGKFILNRNIEFRVAVGESNSLKNLQMDDFEIKGGKVLGYDHRELFDFDMYSACVDKFKDLFLHFQIGHLDLLNKISMMLDKNRVSEFKNHLKANGQSYDDRIVKRFIDLLKEYSWDEIKSKDFFSKTTFYKYKKLFDNAGIRQKNNGYNAGVSFTYDNYFNLMFQDFNYVSARRRF